MAVKTRLFALDFLRGLCLILMTMDHLPRNVLWRFRNTLFGPFGFFTAASAFVFISGLASARSYGSIYEFAGARMAWKRVVQRAIQLYAANTALLLAIFAGIAFHILHGKQWESQFPRFFDIPKNAFLDVLLLLYRPGYFDILPMYVLFMLVVVPTLAAVRRGLGPYVVAISVLIWLLAQLSEQHREAFNPFGYQILFVTGLVLGGSDSFSSRFLPSETARRLAQTCAVGVFVFFMLRLSLTLFGSMSPSIVGWHFLTHLENNGPLRLLNFALLAYVVAWIWAHTPKSSLSGNIAAQWIACLGRHSLFVFLWSIAATYVSISLMPDQTGRGWAILDMLLTISSLAIPVLAGERLRRDREVSGLARIH